MPEDLIERTTIRFPRGLDEKEIKDMVRSLLVLDKGYKFRLTQSGFFNAERDNSEDYINHISGTIARTEPFGLAQISFELGHEEDYPTFVEARFFTTPGYDWEEISQDERALIDDLREDITKYLEKNQ